MAAQLLRRRFTVDEYYRMGQAGILHEDDRVELLEGEIVEMAPIGSRHQGTVNRLTRLFSSRATASSMVMVQGPVRLSENCEPQPDVTLLLLRADFYASAHPGPNDVLLLVEVSDSSIEYDRQVKVPLYARHGITEVWLVDLEAEVVETYRNPGGDGYREVAPVGRGQSLSPGFLPGLEFEVDGILG